MERTTILAASMKCSLEKGASDWQSVLAEAAEKRARNAHEAALLVIVAARDAHGVRSVKSYVKTTPTRAPVAMILGAHEQCDAPNVLGASLRHIALWIDPEMTPGWIHAVDLNTPEGMLVDGEQCIRRVDARCSVRIGAGSADVLAIALAPFESVDLHLALIFAAPFVPRAQMARERNLGSGSAAAQARARVAPAAGAPEQQVMNPSMFSTRDGITHVNLAVMPMERGRGTLVVQPSARELEKGFLVGRYDRCARRLEDHLVSRVHALLVERGDKILVIDTASTNGTDIYAPSAAPPTEREARLRQTPSQALGVVKRCGLVTRGCMLSLGGTLLEIR